MRYTMIKVLLKFDLFVKTIKYRLNIDAIIPKMDV
jgi:hypothetical protein